jgi:hypothetical protein
VSIAMLSDVKKSASKFVIIASPALLKYEYFIIIGLTCQD